MAASRQRVFITAGLAAALLALALAGCSSTPSSTARNPDDGRGSYRVGKPYVIDGKTYYPAEDMSYSETGIASWYGPGFHGRNTANGEVYDQEQISAAHKTLPLPSIVRVTNLDNGKSVVARVNDRGPFVSGRIIDMSKGGAHELGLDISGTAHVRVEILRRESEIVKQVALNGGTRSDQMAALSNPSAAPSPPPSSPPNVLDTTRGPVVASAPPSAPQPVQPVLSASQPIWSPGDPPPTVPMVISSDTTTPSPAPPQNTQVTAVPIAPPANAPASWSSQDTGRPAPSQPVQLAPPPSTLSNQAAVLASPPAPPPQSAPISSGGGRIYVQAGAFAQLDSAERVRVQLSQYANATVSPVQANGHELYRVRLGPVNNAEAADVIRARVLQAGYRDAHVVSD